MTDALTRAAKLLSGRFYDALHTRERCGLTREQYVEKYWPCSKDRARAAILSFLDGIDPTLVTEAWRSGFASALDNIPEGRIGAINDALGKSASLAVISALRALVQEDGK